MLDHFLLLHFYFYHNNILNDIVHKLIKITEEKNNDIIINRLKDIIVIINKLINDNKEKMESIKNDINKLNTNLNTLRSDMEKINLSLPQNNWIKFINKNVKIRSKLGIKNLDVYDGKMENFTNIILFQNNEAYNQKFYLIINTDDGTVSFINGKFAIDCYMGKCENHTNVQIYLNNRTAAQKFYIIYRGYGWYSIHSSLNEKYCLDVNGGKNLNLSNIQLYLFNGSDSQLFKFIE